MGRGRQGGGDGEGETGRGQWRGALGGGNGYRILKTNIAYRKCFIGETRICYIG